jgi:hypothetical protein
LWKASIARIEAWAPQTLFLTHFGPVEAVRPHMQALVENMDWIANLVRTLLDQPGTDDERKSTFMEQVGHELRRQLTDAQLKAYGRAEPLELAWLGLVRYWRKRSA